MQLHRLRLTAIGPFADPVEIDIDKLSASGIFLLEGPTGAGKSTLIDAIVFALYGDVAGRASSTERIASAVAPAGVTPSVELDFSTSHGMFRVRRTPKHARRKRRGNGMTVQNASGSLWRLVSPDAGSAGEPIATRLDEIGAEILDIVGLNREQFVQTVVLPQGEFATFLRADAEQRRGLLQKLFGTEVYDRTVDRLVELRRTAHQQRSAAATSLLGSVSAYCGAAGVLGDDEEALATLVEVDPGECLAVVQEQLDVLSAQATSAKALVTQCSQRAEKARAAHAELSRREAARLRVIELHEKLKGLESESDVLAADIQRLEQSAEAARLAPAIVGLTEARARAASSRTRLEAARRSLPDPDAPTDSWQEHERRCTVAAAALTPLLEVEKQMDAARSRVTELRRERDEVHDRCEALAKVVAEAPRIMASARAALDTARTSSATLGDARAQLESAKAVVRSATELAQLVDEVARAKADTADAARTAKRLVKREAQLRVRFIDGMAGHLSAQLEPEQPCPVCGSIEHPAPAESAEPIGRADVDEAAELAAAATRRLESSQTQLTALEAAAAELRGHVEGRTIEQAGRELDEAERRVAVAETAETQAVQLEHQLDAAERQLTEQRAQLSKAETTRASLKAEVDAAEQSLVRDERAIIDALDGCASLSQRVDTLTAQAVGWRDAAAALQRTTAADRDVEFRSAEVGAAIASSPFASEDDVAAAFLDADVVEQLRLSIEARTALRAACEAELRSPELAATDATEVVDVTAALAEVRDAERTLSEALADQGHLGQRLAESTQRAGEVQSSLAAQRTVIESTAATIRMANLVSASSPDNAKAMSLPTFVLRERFVDVVASANERLATMSEGRYRLEHVEDRRGNRKSGLDLQIRDAHTEQPRDPATLSGGESFYCSLALALGLADVVTSEAGGVDLGTLFVDEGFGSLDPETLEQVLEVLHGLASSGRVVGIVSHVPELKDQVAERISVIPNRDGSSRLIVAA